MAKEENKRDLTSWVDRARASDEGAVFSILMLLGQKVFSDGTPLGTDDVKTCEDTLWDFCMTHHLYRAMESLDRNDFASVAEEIQIYYAQLVLSGINKLNH